MASETMLTNEQQYEDARGVIRTGYIERISDFGGSDITYRMRNTDDQAETSPVTMVSGSRIKTIRATGRRIPVVG